MIEKEHAAKIQTLYKKAAEKKSRMESAMVVGNEPTKAWNQNTLARRFGSGSHGAAGLLDTYAFIRCFLTAPSIPLTQHLSTRSLKFLKIMSRRQTLSLRKSSMR